MTVIDRTVGIAVAAASIGALVGLSHLPLRQDGAAEGLLRLAWRARPERLERCREQSADALRALPAHMRQSLICEGANASYTLEVRRDGAVVASMSVHPGGFRRDRPLYVFQEIAVPVGASRISVHFTRMDSPDTRPSSDDTRRREELTEVVPASLAFERDLGFRAGQVRLISYDPERQMLFEVRP